MQSHSGMGGSYKIIDGERVLIDRTQDGKAVAEFLTDAKAQENDIPVKGLPERKTKKGLKHGTVHQKANYTR